jgi:hypothetical protein
MDLAKIRQSYMDEGLGDLDASAKTAQDVMLALIGKANVSGNVTIKGGVVMQHLSGSNRRATQDFDFDFIRYSIGDDAIRAFIGKLDKAVDGITIAITGKIEELKHQDYKGKRVHVTITDGNGMAIDAKIDIGVHNDVGLEQNEYCFDLAKIDDSVTLLINTKEQIVVEKLKSLLRIGAFSTRYKDVFDIYYLLIVEGVDKAALTALIGKYIFEDETFPENTFPDIHRRLESIFSNRRFASRVTTSDKNWLAIPLPTITEALLREFSK